MHIAFVIKSMKKKGGGAERILAGVVAGLLRRGHRITLVTYDTAGDPSFYPLDPAIARIDLGIGENTGAARPLETLQRMRLLRRKLTRIGPDVVVGFMHSSYALLALALIGSRLKLVASEHTSWDHFASRPLQAALLRSVAPLPSVFTIISERVRSEFPEGIRRRMEIVPNQVAVPVRGMACTAPPPPARRTLLTVGRLGAEKDQATLVEAFARLAPDFPEWDLEIVGEGVLRGDLERRIADASLADRIRLPGAASDIGAVYRAAQLFTIPSLYESFGLVTAEAMAHGLPAVGFADCPGTNEIIGDGVNGLLVEGPNRVAALADGLAKLMGNDKLRQQMAAAAPQAAAPFSIERALDIWEELLTRVTRS